MSGRSDQAIVSAGNAAKRAAGGTREAARLPENPVGLRLATVLAAGDGVYQVALVGSDGEAGTTLSGVRPWGTATFAPGDKVFLTWVGERPVPYIVSGGGSGGGGGEYLVVGIAEYLR